MNTEDAKAYAQNRLKGVEGLHKVSRVSQIIQELAMSHNFRVGCPVTAKPLIGVGLSENPFTKSNQIVYIVE